MADVCWPAKQLLLAILKSHFHAFIRLNPVQREMTPAGAWGVESERLDASVDWLPWPLPVRYTRLQALGDGCHDPTPWNLSGCAVLVSWTKGRDCSYARILQCVSLSSVVHTSVEG